MVACEVCGDSDQFLFQCRHCSGQFCSEHQSPGEHLCAAAPPLTRVRDDRQSSIGGDPDVSSNRPAPEPVEAQGPSSFRVAVHERLLPREVLIEVAVILVAAAALGGIAFLGAGLLSGLETDLSDLTGGQTGGASTAVPIDDLNMTAVERSMVDRINAERADRDAAPVNYDPALTEIAESHSEDMAARDYTSHVSPDGETVNDRYAEFGYECDSPGELIVFRDYGRGSGTVDGAVGPQNETELAGDIVDLWMRSESHRQALLTQPWESVGIGIAVSDDNRVLVTLNAC